MSKLNIIIAAVAVVALVIGIKLWHPSTGKHEVAGGLNAIIQSPPKDVARFSLLDTKGKPFNNNSVWAHWTFIVFGSASHGTKELSETMSALNKMTQIVQAEKQAPNPQVVFVSTDPTNDTLDVITKFTAKFNPDFLGVTGDMKQVGILSQLLPPNKKEVILLIDPAGKLSGLFPEPHHAESMVKDFQIIVQNEG